MKIIFFTILKQELLSIRINSYNIIYQQVNHTWSIIHTQLPSILRTKFRIHRPSKINVSFRRENSVRIELLSRVKNKVKRLPPLRLSLEAWGGDSVWAKSSVDVLVRVLPRACHCFESSRAKVLSYSFSIVLADRHSRRQWSFPVGLTAV